MFDKDRRHAEYTENAIDRGAAYVIKDLASFVHNVDDLEFIANMLESSLRMGGQMQHALDQLQEEE